MDALLYRAKGQDVDTVIVDGEVVLRRGTHTKVNKDDVLNELRDRFASPVEPKVLEARQMVNRLLPYVELFYRNWSPQQGTPHYVFNSRT